MKTIKTQYTLTALFCLLLFSLSAFSQSDTDNLFDELKQAPNDSVKAELYIKIVSVMSRNNPDSSLRIAEVAMPVCKKNELLYAKLIAAIGLVYVNKGDYEKGLQYYFNSLKVREKLKDSSGVASVLNNIGVNFWYQGNFEKAQEYYKRALNIRELLGETKNVAKSLNNLGIVMVDAGKYEEALEYYKRSLKIKNDLADEEGIAASQNNVGMVYEKMKKYDEAIVYYKKAFEMFKKLGNKRDAAVTLNNIAVMSYYEKDHDNAIKYASMSLKLAQDVGDKEDIKMAHETLAGAYYEMGEYKNAFDNLKQFLLTKDSLLNEENSKNMAEIEAIYENDKKQKQIEIQHLRIKQKDLEIDRSKTTKYILWGGLLLLVLIVFLVLNRYFLKQRAAQKIENAYKIIEQKNKDITDSINYAQKIQSAILPNEEIFKQIIPDSFIVFYPRDIVSGDFYWISDRSNYIFYATVDCTGHGVPGGFMSMLGTALLNEIIDERKIESPAEVLNLMRDKIMLALKQAGDNESSRDGMDMVLIRIDKNTLEMQYAAANNSFYIVRNSQGKEMESKVLTEMMCDKMPVGVYRDVKKEFANFTYQLQKGDILYTFTDGYPDQFGGTEIHKGGKKYTYKRLREKLCALSHLPMKQQQTELENEFSVWKGNLEQVDDVCLIGIKI